MRGQFGCGCSGNYWNTLPRSVCGDFDEPENPDQGRCSPYRVKLSCEAPVKPVPECDEGPVDIFFDPTTGGFVVVSILFDENCSAILDHNNDPITTLIS